VVARILIIAGSDSGGGAGIQADVRTVTMLGGHAMTAITAITAQNTLGVQAVHPVPTDMVIAQMESVMSDIGADAVKIGMIGSAQTAGAVAHYLERMTDIPIIFDPVMVATNGSALADDATIAVFERLMRICTIVTPNIPELRVLGGEGIAARFGCLVLAKGGHGKGATLTDRLFDTSGVIKQWRSQRIDTPHTHGTGCTLASALATGLGQGLGIVGAIDRARRYVRESILLAPGFGVGHGPMGVPRGVPDHA
jgi:hydroxymethylpyrimidine/phosphomethylpyrimidine kinase